MSSPREHCQPTAFSSFVVLALLLSSVIASAAPSIALSKRSGPPTSRIQVSGSGFEPNVGVDIFFDTKDKALVVTNGKGEFHDATIYAPRSAYPGQHWVTALERNNDKGAQKPFLVQTDWSQFHFDAGGTRLNPYENVLGPHSVRGMELRWSYLASNGAWGSPAVDSGVAYVATSATLYALDANSGAVRWRAQFCCPDLASSDPAVAKGIVYIGSFDTGLHALDAKTGTTLWNYPAIARVFSAPVVADGIVYFDDAEDDSGDGVYGLDAKTGKLLWFCGTSSSFAAPTIANGVVYVGADDANVYALDAFNGAKLWSYTTDDVVRSSPAVADGAVYVGSFDHNVYALNAVSGAKLWSFATGGWIWTSPAVANGIVYIGSNDHYLYALNAFTGAKLWSYKTGDVIYSSPAVANGVVYVGSLDGNIYGLNASTGDRLWSYTTGDFVESSPTVVNGTVYVGSLDGHAYAFGLGDRYRAKRDRAKRPPTVAPPSLRELVPDLSLTVAVPLGPSRTH